MSGFAGSSGFAGPGLLFIYFDESNWSSGCSKPRTSYRHHWPDTQNPPRTLARHFPIGHRDRMGSALSLGERGIQMGPGGRERGLRMDPDSWFGVDDENIDRAPLERKQPLNPRPGDASRMIGRWAGRAARNTRWNGRRLFSEKHV